MESQFLKFEYAGTTGKTDVYYVMSKSSGFVLGVIKWFGRWRQYCFFPAIRTVFNPGCMQDICEFIKWKMRERVERN